MSKCSNVRDERKLHEINEKKKTNLKGLKLWHGRIFIVKITSESYLSIYLFEFVLMLRLLQFSHSAI